MGQPNKGCIGPKFQRVRNTGRVLKPRNDINRNGENVGLRRVLKAATKCAPLFSSFIESRDLTFAISFLSIFYYLTLSRKSKRGEF